MLAQIRLLPKRNLQIIPSTCICLQRQRINRSPPKQGYSTGRPWSSNSDNEKTDHRDYIPTNPAFYTGNPQYYELLYSIQQAIGGINLAQMKIHQLKSEFPAIHQSVHKTFKSQDALNVDLGLTLKPDQYETLLDHLIILRTGDAISDLTPPVTEQEQKQVMKTISQTAMHGLVSPFINRHEILDQPTAITTTSTGKLKIRPLDKYNRSLGLGSRKTSRARAWIVPRPETDDTAQFFVNGVPVAEYFDRRRVESATFPLHVTRQFGRFNVWVVVRGGGVASQADACSVAVARALASHLPGSDHEDLDKAGLFKSDQRQVERKKPGQKKARKKFAWVKR